jgi:hypothetical protein
MKIFSIFRRKQIERSLTPEELVILQRENEESRLHVMADNLDSALSGEQSLATSKLRQGTTQNGFNAIVGRRVLEPRKHLPRGEEDNI